MSKEQLHQINNDYKELKKSEDAIIFFYNKKLMAFFITFMPFLLVGCLFVNSFLINIEAPKLIQDGNNPYFVYFFILSFCFLSLSFFIGCIYSGIYFLIRFLKSPVKAFPFKDFKEYENTLKEKKKQAIFILNKIKNKKENQ